MRDIACAVGDVVLVCLLLVQLCSWSKVEASPKVSSSQDAPQNKLLVIMLDGFRWDYYDRQSTEKDHPLNGFSQFLADGVRAEWVEPVFPSLSYPTWTTISTGVYPETHGIIGNFMYDLNKLNDLQVFSLYNHTTTSSIHWWQNAEPIWTTATRFKKKAFLKYWSRCDVPFNEIHPESCIGYREDPGIDAMKDTLKKAVEKLKQDFQLVMVYAEHLDNVGHQYGPDSRELKKAMRDVDDALVDFLDAMVDSDLDDKVNVIILGDHGMKWTGNGSGVIYLNLEHYIDPQTVIAVLDRGAVISIVPYARRVDEVYARLKGHEGFDVYKREEIPVEFHYKNARLAQDILVVAKPNYFIHGLKSAGKQIPMDPPGTHFLGGVHGYPNMTEMRTIFFARGPDFKKGITHPPIRMEDVYQIFTKLLDIPSQPHNGSWHRVAGMLLSKQSPVALSSSFLLGVSVALSLLCVNILFTFPRIP